MNVFRKITFLLTAGVSVYFTEAQAQQAACVPPPLGMVGWWAGEGNANDLIAGNNGTVRGGVTFVPGMVGQAFSFNGTDGSVQVPSAANLLLGSGELTIDAWIKTPPWNGSNPVSGIGTILAKMNPVYPYGGYLLATTYQGNVLQFAATDCTTPACGWGEVGSGSSRQPLRSVSVVADNLFHHVAGLRRADGTREIWVDGVLENTRSEPMWNTDSDNPLYIGDLDGLDHYLYPGVADEVELFHRALSGSEIQAIFNAGPAGKCKVSLYRTCLLYDSSKAVRSGATIPIKLQLCDSIGHDLSASTITLHAVSITKVSTSISGPVQDSGNANPDNDFRFDSGLGTAGGYIFNLSTKGLTIGTYDLTFTVTGDSFVYAARFEVQ